MIVNFTPLIEEVEGERLSIPRLSLSETEAVHQKFTLAADASDSDVFPSQLTTVDVLVMTVDGAITYEVNGSNVNIPLDANGYVILWGTAVTALTLSEPNTANVTVKLWAWGA